MFKPGQHLIEKDIREKFGVAEEKQGLELIDAVIAAKSKGSEGALDDEKIKASEALPPPVSSVI